MSYTLESLLNTTEGMEAIRSNSKLDTSAEIVTGVNWFTYKGVAASKIYVSGDNYIGFGENSHHLEICYRDGAVYYMYRQEGTLDTGTKFLKIRVEGYTRYNYTSSSYKLVYEVFLFDDNCLFINVIQTPTNSGYLGVSSITDGTNKTTLNVTAGVTASAPIEILVENAGTDQFVDYYRYPPIDAVSMSVSASKTEYFQGNAIDKSTLTVTCTDASGETREVKSYTLSDFDSSTLGEKTITVTYKELSAELNLTVIEDSVSAILSSSSMQDHYILGEAVNVPSIYVQRLSGKKEFIYEGFEITGFDSETSGTKTVTISYQGCTLEKTVYVAETATISVNDPKTSYLVGIEDFETPSVSVTYDDGTTQYPDPVCTGFDNSELGTCTITVSARGLTTTYDVQITDTLTANIGAGTETDIVATLNVVTGLLSVQGTGETKEVTSGSWGSGGLFDDGGSSNQYAKEAVFGEGITGVYGVCQSMENLSKVTFPSTLTTIGAYSFYYCSSLTELTVPESVSVIGEYAFNYCQECTITILNSECQIADYSLEVKKIRAHTGSTANAYANNNGIEFESIDTIVSIEVTSLPYKTEYFTLAPGVNVSGMVVTGTTDNGGTAEVIDYTVREVDFSEPGQKTVTVTFGELTTQFEITVRNPSFDEINGTATGMTSGSGTGSAPWFMFNGSAAEKITCSVGYIKFNSDSSSSIKICAGSTYTSQNQIYVMETILDNGIRVLKFRELFYNSNMTGQYVVHETFFFSTGDIYINIMHLPEWNASASDYQTKGTLVSNSVTYNMNLASQTPAKRSFYHQDASGLDWVMKSEEYQFQKTPQKVMVSLQNEDYFVGNTFDMTGAVVRLVYGDGTTEESKGYTYTEPDMSKAGVQQITVTDTESGITSNPVNVYVNVNANIGAENETAATAVTDLKNGILTISGTGATKDYTVFSSDPVYPPFYSVDDYIKTISIGDGITRLGSCLFTGFQNLEEISFPENLQEIGSSAFYSFGYGGEISLPGIVKLETDAFHSSSITKCSVGSNIQEIGSYVFSGCKNLKEIHIEKYENKVSGAPWGGGSAEVTWIANLAGIEITTFPEKRNYVTGQKLDVTGIVLSEVYSDGYKEAIPEGYTISDLDSSSPGEKTITVSYKGYTVAFTVTVREKSTGIRISKYPDNTYYKSGDEFDSTGMEAKLILEDGTEETIENPVITGFNSSSYGAKTVTVSYEDDIQGASYSTSINAMVTADGTDPFEKDTIKGKITIHWTNGEFEDITGDEIEGETVTLQEALCNDRYFIFGGCACNQLSFTTGSKQFIGTDVILDDTKIEAFFEADRTKVKLFTGKIASAKRDSGLIRRKIIAYDETYWHRNTDISWWYRNNTVDKRTAFTQKMFRDKLFEFLGIEQVETTLYYDDAFVPTTNIPSEMNAVNIIKDMCLQNKVFGWMNRDGRFEYIKLQENGRVSGVDNAGRQHYGFYEAEYKFDNYRSCEFKEGRIWYPNEFYTDPDPRIGFISGPPATAQEAYDKNTYYNRNSFFCGDAEWFDNVYLCNEYRDPTLQEPIIPICFGPVTTYDNQHLYLAQEYKMVPVYGNPMIKVGSSIEIEVKKTAEDGTELTWYVHSYIMSRTLKIHGSNSISDEYSANNAPYNSNNRQEGTDTTPINTLQTESPTISYEDFTSDAGEEGGFEAFSADETVKKAKLRCVKRIEKSDYDALVEAGNQRSDTLYLTWEDEA